MNKMWHQCSLFPLHSLGRHWRKLYLNLIITWSSIWMLYFQIHLTMDHSNDPFKLLFQLTGREKTHYVVQFSFGPVLCFMRCFRGDDFLVVQTRDDFTTLHGTTPYTPSSPGTPINMPWLGSHQTGRGAAMVSNPWLCYCLSYAKSFLTAYEW